MNERDTEISAEAEAYADYNFKGEVYWREAYESKLIDLIRADEREACAKVCEEEYDTGLLMAPESPSLAARIRARNEK